MKVERLFDIIGLLDEDLIDEAEDKKLKQHKRMNLIKWGVAAACFLIFLGGAWYLKQFSNPPLDMTGAAGGGHSEGSTFMHYAGPVLPLNVVGDTGGITSSRQIGYDFTNDSLQSASIQDKYSITNTTLEDKTFTIEYPYISSLNESKKYTPELILNNSTLEPDLLIGAYCGGFEGVYGSDGMDATTLNLAALSSWKEYSSLLVGGEYVRLARNEIDFKDQEVTVYTFQDVEYPEEYDAATLAISFCLPMGSKVITNGINGMSYDDATNDYQYSYFLSRNEGQRIIILGEPPKEYTLKGYENGACEKDIPEITGTVKAETKLLSEVIKECMAEYLARDSDFILLSPLVTERHLFRAVISMFKYTQLGDSPTDRYEWMRIDDLISEAYAVDRIMYLSKEITVPAGQTVELTSHFIKGASYDFYFSGSEDRDTLGYDMMTSLGSDLVFTKQQASVILPQNYQIVRQNFGFDIENGISEVTLNMNMEHYYLEVSYIESKAN